MQATGTPLPVEGTKPVFRILTPNGGEVWYIGDTVTFIRESANWTGLIMLTLSYDGGETYDAVIRNAGEKSLIPNSGAYIWVVSGKAGTRCRVKISIVTNVWVGYDVPETSDADFTIAERVPER
jgi:hypothetical protein